jgi:elongation factor Ts
MAFTAADVKKLREMTGVGMMDCKKALVATEGDMDKAVEWLREKGLAASQKKAGRIAAEGMAYAEVIDGIGVVVEVNSETDFVASNEKFINFTKGVANTIAKENPKDLDDLLTKPYNGTELTVAQQQQEMVLVIGENIKVRRFARYDSGVNVAYVHMGGRIGVIVNMEVSDNLNGNAEVQTVGKDVAMQVAALNAPYLDPSSVPAEVISQEKQILLAQINDNPKDAAKPDNIKEKMIFGKINKFYKEQCLTEQPFVKDDSVSVSKYVANAAKNLGGTIAIKGFTRYEKGEGIEKKQEDYAAEIASMVNQK